MNFLEVIGVGAIIGLAGLAFVSQGLWLGTGLLIVAILVFVTSLILMQTVGRNMELGALLYPYYGAISAAIIVGIGAVLIIIRFLLERPDAARPFFGLS